MNVYLIIVTLKENKVTYVDSVWENNQDAWNHVETCIDKGIFDNTVKIDIKKETLMKHFK